MLNLQSSAFQIFVVYFYLQSSEPLYDEDDYFFSEPYEGLIYTKRKEPPVSGEYDSGKNPLVYYLSISILFLSKMRN